MLVPYKGSENISHPKLVNFRGTTSFTRSCQTVLAAHLLSVARAIAPILPHLAEDVNMAKPPLSAYHGRWFDC